MFNQNKLQDLTIIQEKSIEHSGRENEKMVKQNDNIFILNIMKVDSDSSLSENSFGQYSEPKSIRGELLSKAVAKHENLLQ